MRRIVPPFGLGTEGGIQMQPLQGRVAVVAGATRGAGRGIATALGESGAIVYCTGRSTRAAGATPGRPETIDETAEIVTRAGGQGIHVAQDRPLGALEALRERAGGHPAASLEQKENGKEAIGAHGGTVPEKDDMGCQDCGTILPP